MELLIVSLASLLAGFVDTLFGTNKGASIWGTGVATTQYARRVEMRWRALLPAAAAGFGGSLAGAWLVTLVDPGFLRKALPFVLLAVLVYTLVKKDLGRHHAPRFTGAAETWIACCIGLVVAALGLFAWKGHVWWHFALTMAVANVLGSVLGTRLALRHGAGFVRIVFIAVVSVLILKTGFDAFVRSA